MFGNDCFIHGSSSFSIQSPQSNKNRFQIFTPFTANEICTHNFSGNELLKGENWSSRVVWYSYFGHFNTGTNAQTMHICTYRKLTKKFQEFDVINNAICCKKEIAEESQMSVKKQMPKSTTVEEAPNDIFKIKKHFLLKILLYISLSKFQAIRDLEHMPPKHDCH